jgi:hypothetical protein
MSLTAKPAAWYTKYAPGLIFFLVAIIIGLLFYKDYGVSWDEPIQRAVGDVTYKYVFHNDKSLLTYDDRGLGTGFELPLIMLEKALQLTDTRDIDLMRHLATHLFFLFSVFCGYVLAWRLFKNQYIACLGFILLAFTPRIYAHSFFNTKDIPFLSAFLIALMFAQVAFSKDKAIWYLVLGFACGYATSIRAMGVLLLPAIGVFLIIDFLRAIYLKEKAGTSMANLFLFIAGFCVLLYMAWPVLWSRPFFYFQEEYTRLAHIQWTGDVFFKGKNVSGAALPLDYVPVWFSITVPELWLICGLAGFVWTIISLFRKPAQYIFNTNDRNFLLYAGCFVLPVLTIVLLNSVNYDDWRHLYFIYPSFVMLALFTIHNLVSGGRVQRLIMVSLCGIQVLSIAFFMIGNHPYQNVYFNHFISHKKEYLRKHYDLEYWGCAYSDAMRYILAHDTSSSPIRIVDCSFMTKNALGFLPPAQRQRIVLVGNSEHADYFITNYRNHPENYDYPKKIYTITVLNSTILDAYKMHN